MIHLLVPNHKLLINQCPLPEPESTLPEPESTLPEPPVEYADSHTPVPTTNSNYSDVSSQSDESDWLSRMESE